MTGWEVLNEIINGFPPFAIMLLFTAVIAALFIFIIGFAKHGVNFIKGGFMQNYQSFTEILETLATKEDLEKFATKEDLEKFAKKEDLEKFATKEDIARIEKEMREEMEGFRGELEGFRGELAGFRTELTTIKVNHFGHLKNFLTELTSILVDKNIFTNENKARLDNHLRDM